MRYSEYDLRATLSDLEHEAPDTETILAGVERLRRRRTVRQRTVGVVAAVAVTVAVAAVSTVVPNLGRDQAQRQEPATASSEMWRFSFAVDDIPGHRVEFGVRGTADQTAWVVAGTEQDYQIHVFAAGAYDPTAARAGQPVDVNGKAGFYRADMPCHCSGKPPITGLAWEYAPNAWALVQQHTEPGQARPDAAAALQRIARAVRFDRTTPLRVPFTVGYLPDGLRPGTDDPLGSGSMGGGITPDIVLQGANPEEPGLTLSARGLSPTDLPVGEPVAKEDLPFGRAVLINLGQFTVQLSSGTSAESGIPLDELIRIARSIRPAADYNDPATWFDAEQAIPAN